MHIQDGTSENIGNGVHQQIQPNLSEQVFKNPQAFLSILSADFDLIKGKGATVITEHDLEAYAEKGKDPEGRLAAKIAVAHFDDLSKMPSKLPLWDAPRFGSRFRHWQRLLLFLL